MSVCRVKCGYGRDATAGEMHRQDRTESGSGSYRFEEDEPTAGMRCQQDNRSGVAGSIACLCRVGTLYAACTQ